jgi:hypothetical protein
MTEAHEDVVPDLGEKKPPPRETVVTLVGEDPKRKLDELVPLVAGASEPKDVVLTAIGVLYKARGRRIQLVDTDGEVGELDWIWR